MGDIAGGLFGGEESQTQTSTSIATLPSWIQSPIQSLVGKTTSLMDKPYEAYTGQRQAGLTPQEMQAFGLASTLQGQTGGQLNQANLINQEVANRGLNGYSNAQIQQFMNPYTQNVLDISRGRQLDEFDRAKNQLAARAGQTAAFGGSRQGVAEQNLYQNFARQLSENEQMGLHSAYESALGQAGRGTAMAGASAAQQAQNALQGQQAGLADMGMLSQAGGAQRQFQQQGLDLNYQDFLSEQAYPYEQVQFGAGILNPIGSLMRGQTNSQTTTTEGGGSGILGAALGLGSMALGIPGVGSALGGAFASSGLGSALSSGLGSLFAGGSSNGSYGAPIGPTQSPNWGAFYGLGNHKDGGVIGYADGGQIKNYDQGGLVSQVDGFLSQLFPEDNGPQDTRSFIPEVQPMPVQSQQFTGVYPTTPQGGGKEESGGGEGLGKMAQLAMMFLKDGGQVKNYSEGGLFGFDSAPGSMSLLSPEGRSAAFNAYGNTPFVDKFGKYVFENPIESAGLAAMAIPGVGPATRLATGVGSKALPALTKGGQGVANFVAKHPKLAVGGLGAATFLGAKVAKGGSQYEKDQKAIQEALNDPNRIETASPASKAIQTLSRGAGGAKKAEEPKGLAAAVQQAPAKKEAEMNMPLIAFGAALMGSKHGFFKALGEGAGAYAAQKKADKVEATTAEAEMRKYAMELSKLELDRQRANSYAQSVAQQGASNPYKDELAKVKLALSLKKLNAPDTTAVDLMKTGMFHSIEDAQAAAAKLSGGSVDDNEDTGPSTEDLLQAYQNAE